MGKIKEAYMIQEDIKESVKENYNLDLQFDILDFCHENKVKPDEVEGMVLKMMKLKKYHVVEEPFFGLPKVKLNSISHSEE